MDILITGSGTAVPSVRRCAAGYLVEVAGSRLQIDTGPGTVRQLAHYGYQPNDIDALCYTHTHPDHVCDVVPFLFASRYGQDPARARPLHIFGGNGFADFLHTQQAIYGHWLEPDRFELIVHELSTTDEDQWEGEGFTLRSRPMNHIPTSIAYRVEEHASGRSFVFSGDTDVTPELSLLARNSDLLICECANPEDGKSVGHLIPSEVGRLAADSGCARLVLTHFYPPCDESDLITPLRRHYQGPVDLAEDGMRITV